MNIKSDPPTQFSQIENLQVAKPARVCYRICSLLITSLVATSLAVGGHKPDKGPTEWRSYKFKGQDMKAAEKECDAGGKPLPEYVPTVREGEPNLALLKQSSFKVLNTIGNGAHCPKPHNPNGKAKGRHCGKFLNDGFYNNCRSWIIGPLESWGQIDIGSVGTVNRVFPGSDHSQGFADRVLSDFDILVSTTKAPDNSNAPSWKKVYKHKEGPVRETTEIKFKETQAQWVRIHIRGADGARVDELEIYGGSNPLSVDSASKLTTIWSQIKIDSQ